MDGVDEHPFELLGHVVHPPGVGRRGVAGPSGGQFGGMLEPPVDALGEVAGTARVERLRWSSANCPAALAAESLMTGTSPQATASRQEIDSISTAAGCT